MRQAASSPALEPDPSSPYVERWRVLLRLASKASHPGDLKFSLRELSLPRIVVPGTWFPPGKPGPSGLNRLHGFRGAATLFSVFATP